MLLYFVIMGFSVIMPLYVQNTLGQSATVSAFAMMPSSLAMAVMIPFAGRIYDSLGMKPLLVGGTVCLLASNVGMAVLPLEAPVWASAALNTLRTVAGSIGSAVFVGIMETVAGGTSSGGASMHGDNVAFAAMTAASVALLAMGLVICGHVPIGDRSKLGHVFRFSTGRRGRQA